MKTKAEIQSAIESQKLHATLARWLVGEKIADESPKTPSSGFVIKDDGATFKGPHGTTTLEVTHMGSAPRYTVSHRSRSFITGDFNEAIEGFIQLAWHCACRGVL